MTTPVDRIFIHHEGAGDPRDNFGFGAPFYTAAIGVQQSHIYRTPATDIATKHFNHVSAGIVFSGNRMVHPITDHDLVLLRGVVAQLRNRGDITASPTVLPHRLTPGLTTGTVCPGDLTMARWDDVRRAITDGLNPHPTTPVEDDVTPEQVELKLHEFVGNLLNNQAAPWTEYRQGLRFQVREALKTSDK